MDLKLKNKKALVTGASQGIGKAIAQSLLQEGTTVFINGRSLEKLEATATELSKATGGKVFPVAADFSKKEEVDALLEKVGEVDILINNVGFFEPKKFEEISDEDWLKIFEVNVLSGIRLSRYYLPKMLSKNWGRILFISSESAINIPEEMIHYGATKTIQLAISRGLAERTKGTDVTVNTVLPGPTWSEGIEEFIGALAKEKGLTNHEMEEDFFSSMRPSSLIQRFAKVEEVAHTVTYLSSPLSSATNGSTIRVDGGVVKSII